VLRDNPKNREILKEAVRQAHTIKGTAAMMSFAQIAEVASHMENSLQELGQDQVEADVKMINALCQNLDTLKVLLEDIVKEKESSA
jgi:chemotaxis protein histidine kinase CheA